MSHCKYTETSSRGKRTDDLGAWYLTLWDFLSLWSIVWSCRWR